MPNISNPQENECEEIEGNECNEIDQAPAEPVEEDSNAGGETPPPSDTADTNHSENRANRPGRSSRASQPTGEGRASVQQSDRRSSVIQVLPDAKDGGATGTANKAVNMFADADAMREAAHENIGKRDYDVTDFYWETGYAQAIARSAKFETCTLIVIGLNAVWLGVDVECNDPNAIGTIPNCPAQPRDKGVWEMGEHAFCVFFTFELLIRFGAFQHKMSAFHDNWFKFDSVLVFFMVVETWLLPICTGGNGDALSDFALMRMLRLLRLTRMVRLMRSFPELMTLMKGMGIACRSVSYTLLLLLIFMYIFSIIFKSQLVDTEVPDLRRDFKTIPRSMWTLLLHGCLLDDISNVANDLGKHSALMACTFIVFVLLSALMVLNMLIGVLCAVVTAVAAAEKEKALVSYVKSKLISVLESLDEDGNGTISQDEFKKLVEHNEAKQALEDLGVDVPNLVSLSDHLFEGEDVDDGHHRHSKGKDCRHSAGTLAPNAREDNGGQNQASEEDDDVSMTFADFLEMVIRLRSDNNPSVSDIVELRKLIFKGQKQFTKRLNHIEKGQQELQKGIRMICEQLDAALTLSLKWPQEREHASVKQRLPKRKSSLDGSPSSTLRHRNRSGYQVVLPEERVSASSVELVHHEL